MIPAPLHRAIGTIGVQGYVEDFRTFNSFWNFHVGFSSKGSNVDVGLLRIGSFNSIQFKLYTVRASPIHSAVANTILSSHGTIDNVEKMSKESTLILIRHGESLWNEQNLFSGCVDVPLTKKGIEESIEAGKRISNIPIDVIFTSALIRAQMTAMLALTQHQCQKVPVIIHNESEHAKTWSQIYSEDTKKQSIPVVKAWQLNERIYGELQGFNKKETAERFGKKQVHEWRRSYGTCPPNGESLEMCYKRAVAYFREHIEPELFSGKHVMVAAHANSLRAIIVYLDNLTSEEVVSLELSNGVPMLYICKDEKFIRRGSPLGSTEAGVYSYTSDLALYRSKLDEMAH